MSFFVGVLVSGLSVGSVYALLALGLILIYKTTKVFNLAIGGFVLAGGYISWSLVNVLGFPLWLSLPAIVLICLALGLAVERFCLRPMLGQSMLAQIMMTIAIGFLLPGIVMLIWTSRPRALLPIFAGGNVEFLGTTISSPHLITLVVAMVLFGTLAVLFNRTNVGLAMRATAEDSQVSQCLGITVTTVYALCWGIASMSCGIGGLLLGTMTTVSPTLSEYGFLAFPVMILGGADSLKGAVIAGFLIGVLQSVCIAYVEPVAGGGWGVIAPFIVMILILLVKPYRLFGMVRIERV